MTIRARRLRRLLSVRRLSEEAERQRLQIVFAGIREAEAAVDVQHQAIGAAWEQATAALSYGDSTDRLFAEATAEIARANLARLAPLLQERSSQEHTAMTAYLDRRREHDQARLLVEHCTAQEQVAADRRAQIAAGDWFLSRLLRARG